jgi:hypothetical protein
LARLLNGRKTGKGKFVAKCPSHPDRTPSLAIAEGKKGVLLKCMSAGCETVAILEALGLRWSDLFDGKPTKEVRERLTWQEHRDSLERQLGLVAVLGAIDGKRAYWAAAEKRMQGELQELRCRLEPEQVWQEYRERMFQARVRRDGWERVWEAAYGVDGARSSAGPSTGEVRRQWIHREPHIVSAGRVQARPDDDQRNRPHLG